MKVKDGVLLFGLQLEMREVLIEADIVYKKHGQELVVTSTTDGVHSPGSMHPYGYAIDFRTWYFDSEEQIKVRDELADALGDMYDVVLETTHLHVEYDWGQ